jgi:hypothetical protein
MVLWHIGEHNQLPGVGHVTLHHQTPRRPGRRRGSQHLGSQKGCGPRWRLRPAHIGQSVCRLPDAFSMRSTAGSRLSSGFVEHERLAARRKTQRSAACGTEFFPDVTLAGCSLSSVASRYARGLAKSLWKMRGCARGQQIAAKSRQTPRLGRPGDELGFADHLTLMRLFSTSSP